MPQLYFFALGPPRGALISVDVTKRCNLRCRHCYFFTQEHGPELSADEWERRIVMLKRRAPFLHSCTWVGGEPLLRRDVIERCKRYFLHNLVVTNGTIPLPDWPDVFFHVSVDGTEEVHDAVRGQPGLYRRVRRNASRRNLRVTGAMAITTMNAHTVEAVMEEWRGSGINGFIFDFFTPVEGLDSELWLDWAARDRLLDRLMELKRGRHGDFIVLPMRVMELMKSHHARDVTARCIFARAAYALCTDGRPKEKCMLGPNADCERCGCVVPFYLHYRMARSEIIRLSVREIRDLVRRRLRSG